MAVTAVPQCPPGQCKDFYEVKSHQSEESIRRICGWCGRPEARNGCG
ncbi:hypothetical protein SEA_PRINGAR_18 [Mycobacterium phage Pringar]|uniref:Uncharacterized protein n=2 Tax=Marvinvirus marvin TaxID=1982092 RepID=A0A385UHW3_9CAUD|nr:hypothetical protein SEA_VASUNZINGA_17 [Mycobacterium phage VasuNzinga]QFP96882.1 hypothetical protein SEA_PRINGAR_18 [Mycobacterium phage Pringar]